MTKNVILIAYIIQEITNTIYNMVQFEGMVNGVKFTDVREYSTARAAAVRAGHCDCSERYVTVPDEQPQDDQALSYEAKIKKYGFLPILDLDAVTASDSDTDSYIRAYDNYNGYDALITKIREVMTPDEIWRLRKDITEIHNHRAVQQDKSKRAVDVLTGKINNLEDQLQKLKDRREVCSRAVAILSRSLNYFERVQQGLNGPAINFPAGTQGNQPSSQQNRRQRRRPSTSALEALLDELGL